MLKNRSCKTRIDSSVLVTMHRVHLKLVPDQWQDAFREVKMKNYALRASWSSQLYTGCGSGPCSEQVVMIVAAPDR